jgi:hypothetical protein
MSGLYKTADLPYRVSCRYRCMNNRDAILIRTKNCAFLCHSNGLISVLRVINNSSHIQLQLSQKRGVRNVRKLVKLFIICLASLDTNICKRPTKLSEQGSKKKRHNTTYETIGILCLH